MAASYTLSMTFTDSEGKGMTINIPSAYSEIDASTVNTVMDTFITNGSIFAKVPTTKKSAKLVAKTETSFAMSTTA